MITIGGIDAKVDEAIGVPDVPNGALRYTTVDSKFKIIPTEDNSVIEYQLEATCEYTKRGGAEVSSVIVYEYEFHMRDIDEAFNKIWYDVIDKFRNEVDFTSQLIMVFTHLQYKVKDWTNMEEPKSEYSQSREPIGEFDDVCKYLKDWLSLGGRVKY